MEKEACAEANFCNDFICRKRCIRLTCCRRLPAATSRFSTFRSDSGKRIYIITTGGITSADA